MKTPFLNIEISTLEKYEKNKCICSREKQKLEEFRDIKNELIKE